MGRPCRCCNKGCPGCFENCIKQSNFNSFDYGILFCNVNAARDDGFNIFLNDTPIGDLTEITIDACSGKWFVTSSTFIEDINDVIEQNCFSLSSCCLDNSDTGTQVINRQLFFSESFEIFMQNSFNNNNNNYGTVSLIRTEKDGDTVINACLLGTAEYAAGSGENIMISFGEVQEFCVQASPALYLNERHVAPGVDSQPYLLATIDLDMGETSLAKLGELDNAKILINETEIETRRTIISYPSSTGAKKKDSLYGYLDVNRCEIAGTRFYVDLKAEDGTIIKTGSPGGYIESSNKITNMGRSKKIQETPLIAGIVDDTTIYPGPATFNAIVIEPEFTDGYYSEEWLEPSSTSGFEADVEFSSETTLTGLTGLNNVIYNRYVSNENNTGRFLESADVSTPITKTHKTYHKLHYATDNYPSITTNDETQYYNLSIVFDGDEFNKLVRWSADTYYYPPLLLLRPTGIWNQEKTSKYYNNSIGIQVNNREIITLDFNSNIMKKFFYTNDPTNQFYTDGSAPYIHAETAIDSNDYLSIFTHYMVDIASSNSESIGYDCFDYVDVFKKPSETELYAVSTNSIPINLGKIFLYYACV